jgi:hypothetical protein
MLKECFTNSQKTLLFGDVEHRLSYAEGLIRGNIHHAWLLINDKVVDLTLRPASVGIQVRARKHLRERVTRALAIAGRSEPAAPRKYMGALATRDELLSKLEGTWQAIFPREAFNAIGTESGESR